MIKSGYAPTNESVDPFKGLKKVKDPSPGKSLPAGYVTDGYGNVYQVPKSGTSTTVKAKGYLARYNYSKKVVEVLDPKSKKVIYSVGLGEGNWFDGPEHWAEVAVKEFEDEAR